MIVNQLMLSWLCAYYRYIYIYYVSIHGQVSRYSVYNIYWYYELGIYYLIKKKTKQ